MKLHYVLVVVVLAACSSATAARPWVEQVLQEWTDEHNGPLEVINRNTSTGPYAMTELRAVNDVGCAHDLGTTGSQYDDPTDDSLRPNTAFLVSESACNGMQIKSNSGRIELRTFPAEPIAIDQGRLVLPESSCPAPMPAKGAVLCVDGSGVVWVSTKTGMRAF